MSVPTRAASSEAQAALAFACLLELALSAAGFCTDKDTVYEPKLISRVRPIAEFTVSADTGTFCVTVEHVGEETTR